MENTLQTTSENAEGECENPLEPATKIRRTRWGQSAPQTTSESYQSSATVQSAVAAAALAAQVKKSDMAARAANAKAALEKAKKALALQKQIQQQIGLINVSPGILSAATRSGLMVSNVAAALRSLPSSKPLRFDRFGREIDAEGKVIEIKPVTKSTLKVNINKERETKLKQATFLTKFDRNLVNQSTNPWYDSTLFTASKTKHRGLSFVERGFYTKRERLLRAKELAHNMGLNTMDPATREDQRRKDEELDATLKRIFSSQHGDKKSEDIKEPNDSRRPDSVLDHAQRSAVEDGVETLKPEISADLSSTNILENQHKSHTGTTYEQPSEWSEYRDEAFHLLQRKQIGIIPDVEWWDQPLLKKSIQPSQLEGEDPDFPYVILYSAINDLVEHPVAIDPVIDIGKEVNPILYLTQKERSKLRRRRRQEKERDKRDRIRMGLMAPSPPRVKLGNLARVLGSIATANPSKTEQAVRQQVEQRHQEHKERNQARQLDPEAKRKKTIMKWTKMPSEAEVPFGGAEVCVFSVTSLSEPSHLFKVHKNAQQLHVTGACIVCPHTTNLVIVEGSHKALKGFKKLMLRRIKWNETSEDAEQQNTHKSTKDVPNTCMLLWEGVVKDRSFKQWKVYTCKSEAEIRKMLSDRNSEHYWELLRKTRQVL